MHRSKKNYWAGAKSVAAEVGENICWAECDWMTDQITRIKETARDKDLSALQMDLQTGNEDVNLNDYFQVHNPISTRFGITFVDDKVVAPVAMREWVLNSLHLFFVRINKDQQQRKHF